jgi:hypothetical protein
MNDRVVQPYPAGQADLSDGGERLRLGPAAWKAFGRLMAIWKVPAEQSRELLGFPKDASLTEIDGALLSEEQLKRISYLIGIYEALHILFRDALADRWGRLPNDNVMFGGQKPLDYMAQGGIEALRNVRKLIDARCAGNL